MPWFLPSPWGLSVPQWETEISFALHRKPANWQFLKECALGTKGPGLEVTSPLSLVTPGSLDKSLQSDGARISQEDNSAPRAAPLEITMAYEVVQGGWRSTYH